MSPRKPTSQILLNYQNFPHPPFPECEDEVRIVNWLLLYTTSFVNQELFHERPSKIIGAIVGQDENLNYANLRSAVDITMVSRDHTRSVFRIPHSTRERNHLTHNVFLVGRLSKTLVHVPDANLRRVYCPLLDARDDNRMCWWSIKLSDLINACEYAKNQHQSLRLAIKRRADWTINVDLSRNDLNRPPDWSLTLDIKHSPKKEN